MSLSIGVTDPTGKLGRLVTESLKRRTSASNIVALGGSATEGSSLGVRMREFDRTASETWAPSLDGVETLLLISGDDFIIGDDSRQRIVQHERLIRAAERAGVKRIVYTSMLGAETSPLPLAAEHRAMEAALKNSAVRHTILRNGWHTEHYLVCGALKLALGTNELVGCAGSGRISSASREDYAEAMAVVLTSNWHDGRTYELAGDTSWTMSDLAAELSLQTRRQIPYRDLPAHQYARTLENSGMQKEFANVFAITQIAIAAGQLFDDGHQLSMLLDRPTTALPISVGKMLEEIAPTLERAA